MSRIDAHFTLRLPVDLKADVEASAKANGRSLNAEIVHRLGGTDMPRAKYPSETAERFQVRLPDGLRDSIRAAAESNGRSMNSEICHRLEASEGRTLRDQFAGQFAAAIIAKAPHKTDVDPNDAMDAAEQISRGAYFYADAMLRAREVKS